MRLLYETSSKYHSFCLLRHAISGRGRGGWGRLQKTDLFEIFFLQMSATLGIGKNPPHLWNSPKIHPIRQGQTLLN